MPASDLVFRFVYPASDARSDGRTVDVSKVEGTHTIEYYKFFHPYTGHVDWSSNTTAKVCFGMDEMPMSELRRVKKPGVSKSRRFRAGSAEYKWKICDNGKDLVCVSTHIASFGKNIAEWSQDSLTLRVSERAEAILDRVVMTCFLNLHMKNVGRW